MVCQLGYAMVASYAMEIPQREPFSLESTKQVFVFPPHTKRMHDERMVKAENSAVMVKNRDENCCKRGLNDRMPSSNLVLLFW